MEKLLVVSSMLCMIILSPSSPADIHHSTFFGGSEDDYISDMAIDTDGTVIVIGRTSSLDFPVTKGAFSDTYGGGVDAFAARLTSDLSQVLASTFIGGTDRDEGRRVHLDNAGYIIIMGATRSSDFPVTPGAWDTTYNGEEDIFVTRLSPSLDIATFSTYLGGDGNDNARGSAIHISGDLVLTGNTASENFPVTPGAYDIWFGSDFDLFVSRISLIDGTPVASTFVGSHVWAGGSAVAINSNGDVIVAGSAYDGFPTTSNAYQTTNNGTHDNVVFRMKPNLASLGASTFLGGSESDSPREIELDHDGSIVITGTTHSPDFPVTADAFDTEYAEPWENFISILSPRLDDLVTSTFTSPRNIHNSIQSLSISDSGDLVTAGRLGDLPSDDACIMTMPLSLEEIRTVTMIGGNGHQIIRRHLELADGRIIVAGSTDAIDFPTTPGAFDNTLNDPTSQDRYNDGFISILDADRYDTIGMNLSCSPPVLEVPTRCRISIHVANTSHFFRHVDLGLNFRLPSGSVMENIRFGHFEFVPGGRSYDNWPHHIPALPSLVGTTAFVLHAVDVTPPPWNQPPYPPSGLSYSAEVPLEIVLP